jgi:hypothetical protein
VGTVATAVTTVLAAAALAGAAPHRPSGDSALPWGLFGHQIAARAAHSVLPSDMPAFFREAGAQLVYLDAEPDRWRNGNLTEMDQAWSYDHYIDLENIPDGALGAPDRFVFLRALYDAGLERPERDVGFLPFRIVELYQRIVTEWRMWRAETDPEKRSWIEARIINDAGLLGHYVTDGSQPHHTTIHFNGWSPGAANPEAYTEDRRFHSRFERSFVEAHVTQADVSRRVGGRPRSVAGSARAAVMDYLRASHATVDALYRLDRDVGFDPGGPLRPEARDFAADRLAAGASMLAVLWRSAWDESAR